MTPAELEAMQLASLIRLLTHAKQRSPYYQDLWQRLGREPSDVRRLADFSDWPTIDRSTIIAHRDAMKVPGLKLISKATGGSSGQPVSFDLNLDSGDRRVAATHRAYGWAGAEPGARVLYLWGGAIAPRSTLARVKDGFYHRLYRRHLLNAFELGERTVPQFLEQHNRCRPDAVVAYTNPLYEFARALEERGLRPYSPKSIVVGAEKLHDFQRALIERVFGAPVFETYGSREFMLMASECDRHEGLHLTHENLLIEVLDDDGTPTPPGREGNVAVTDLFNYGMPFIRYLNGDRAVAGWRDCSCGRGLPLMAPPLGRVLDVLRMPDGRRVAGELFPHLMKDVPGVRRFQVEQDEPDRIVIRVVPAATWTDESRRLIENTVRPIVGPAVRLTFDVVDDIPLTKAGKLRVVINRCQAASDPSAALETTGTSHADQDSTGAMA
jgi:phenylacetate-CoA ligase